MEDRERPYEVEATTSAGKDLGGVGRDTRGFPLVQTSMPPKRQSKKRGKYSRETIRLLGHVTRRG